MGIPLWLKVVRFTAVVYGIGSAFVGVIVLYSSGLDVFPFWYATLIFLTAVWACMCMVLGWGASGWMLWPVRLRGSSQDGEEACPTCNYAECEGCEPGVMKRGHRTGGRTVRRKDGEEA